MLEKMERETGIEPATSSLGSWRSTAELLPLTSKMQRLTLIPATQNAMRQTKKIPPDAALGKLIQIIILGELICKECSFRHSASAVGLPPEFFISSDPGMRCAWGRKARAGIKRLSSWPWSAASVNCERSWCRRLRA